MTKVSKTETHDSLRLRITFDDGKKINLSISRSGERISSSNTTAAELRYVFAGFQMKIKETGNFGKALAAVAEIAAKAHNPCHFGDLLTGQS